MEIESVFWLSVVPPRLLPFASFSFIFVSVFTSPVFAKPAFAFPHTHTKISRFYAVNLKYTRYKCSAWKRLLSANDCRKYSFKTIRECSQGMDEDASPELSQTLWISAEVISMITFANYVLIYHTALNVYTALGIMKLHIWFLYTVKFIPPSPHR